MSVGIVVGLSLETTALTRQKLRAGERIRLGGDDWVEVCGVGPEQASRSARALLRAGAEGLVSWGFCAGLDPELRTGALVLPRAVIGAGLGEIPVDPWWHEQVWGRVSPRIDASGQRLAECREVLIGPWDKAALLRDTGAVAADMESAAVGRAAREAAVPFLAVRAVVDPADLALPEAAVDAPGRDGTLRLRALVRGLLSRPADLPAMVCLGIAFHRARATLAEFYRDAGPALRRRHENPIARSRQP